MANPAADYKVIGVAQGRVIEERRPGAPTEGWLVGWGRRGGCAFVIRYFPSRRGWRILDIRNVQFFAASNRHSSWYTGQQRGERYYPNEDAAVMVAMAMLGVTPITS